MKKTILLLASFSCVSLATLAQSFIPAFDRFSGKEVAYIYLEDGSKVEGTIDDLDRKKGLIEEVTILPTGQKKKRKLEPKDIKTMYLPASGYFKLVNALDQSFDAQKWKNNDVNMEIINKGYAYFEKTKVKVKRDTQELLMQMVNPSFSSKIKVFHDPLAQESLGFGVVGVDEVACEFGLFLHEQLDLALAELGTVEFVEPVAVVDCILRLDGGEHGVLV